MKKKELFIVKLFCVAFAILCYQWPFAQTQVKSNNIKINFSDSIVEFSITKKKISRLKQGEIYYWFKNQRVYSTEFGYSGYLLDGDYKVFYVDGQLSSQGQFKKGIKTGVWKFWSASGTLIGRIEYPLKQQNRVRKRHFFKERLNLFNMLSSRNKHEKNQVKSDSITNENNKD